MTTTLKPPPIGALRRRLTLEALERTSDGAGGNSGSWTLVTILWAAIQPRQGSESFDAGQPGANAPVVTLAEALSRPLFQRNRRPFVPEAVPVDPPPNLEETVEAVPTPVIDTSQLMLKGVLVLPGLTRALIATANNPEGVWVEPGATVDVWTVKSLDQDSVSLVSGETEVQLKLYVDKPLN